MAPCRWFLAASMLGGCAGAASSELGDRVARLEARVEQLERPANETGAPNTIQPWLGPNDGGADASAGDGGRMGMPFPIVRKPKWDGGVRIVLADSGPDALATFRLCIGHAEQRCRQTVVVEAPSSSGLRWKRRVSLARAQDSAAGRKCLAAARGECKRSQQAIKERNQRFARLDAELTPKNIDQAFTAKLQRVLAEDAGAGAIQVVCNERFCRFRGVRRHVHLSFQVSRLLPNSTGSMSWRGTVYITRNGYMFPRLGRPPARMPKKPTTRSRVSP